MTGAGCVTNGGQTPVPLVKSPSDVSSAPAVTTKPAETDLAILAAACSESGGAYGVSNKWCHCPTGLTFETKSKECLGTDGKPGGIRGEVIRKEAEKTVAETASSPESKPSAMPSYLRPNQVNSVLEQGLKLDDLPPLGVTDFAACLADSFGEQRVAALKAGGTVDDKELELLMYCAIMPADVRTRLYIKQKPSATALPHPYYLTDATATYLAKKGVIMHELLLKLEGQRLTCVGEKIGDQTRAKAIADGATFEADEFAKAISCLR